MTAALRMRGFGFSYAGASRPSLADVSLELAAGQVVAVLSPQGSGKTTLLRAAAGLLGEVYDGEIRGSIERASPERPGAFFDGYVQVTLAVETVREEIALPLYAAGVARTERDRRVEHVAVELRIGHLLDRDVTALSGGEEKLVGIGAALVANAHLHVLDEPFEQLDVAHFSAVIRALRSRARAGRLVLVSTGSVDTALNIADAAVLFDGAHWRHVERPTYADVASVAGLSNSSLGNFLRARSIASVGVRRFRDGVRLVPADAVATATGQGPRPVETGMRGNAAPLLKISSVSFAYPGGVPVLRDASLDVDPHTVCGILGPNGAGKSTLARLAAGVFQPTGGRVLVGGRDLAGITGPRRARAVRVSFQTPEHELFRPTLGDELDWEARLLGVDAAEMRERTLSMLAMCHADIPLDKHPYDLDPWQRKLFTCVAALAVPGRLVILDEPTLRLGQEVRAHLGTAIAQYADEGGAVVFVTHDHEFAASTCHAIAVVRNGEIEAAGSASTVLAATAGHAATNIYSFPSYYLARAVRRRRA